jgi:hypothetical protein
MAIGDALLLDHQFQFREAGCGLCAGREPWNSLVVALSSCGGLSW